MFDEYIEHQRNFIRDDCRSFFWFQSVRAKVLLLKKFFQENLLLVCPTVSQKHSHFFAVLELKSTGNFSNSHLLLHEITTQ